MVSDLDCEDAVGFPAAGNWKLRTNAKLRSAPHVPERETRRDRCRVPTQEALAKTVLSNQFEHRRDDPLLSRSSWSHFAKSHSVNEGVGKADAIFEPSITVSEEVVSHSEVHDGAPVAHGFIGKKVLCK